MNRRELFKVSAGSVVATGLASCTNASELSFTARQKLLSGFAVNLESWWEGIPFEERFDVAAQAGFTHVEFWFVNDWKRDAKTLTKLAQDAGVKVSQIVGSAPELARPDMRDIFVENCQRAIEEAQTLGTDIVTITGHQNVDDMSEGEALKHYQDHMAAVVPLFETAQIYAAIEPFNPFNHPGHFINGHVEALRMCREINSPFVKINWDLFHMQRHEGNLIDNLRKGADQICYMQMADSPDRHQPGTGEINYIPVIKAARAVGYSRPIGLELWAKDKDYDRAIVDILSLAQEVST